MWRKEQVLKRVFVLAVLFLLIVPSLLSKVDAALPSENELVSSASVSAEPLPSIHPESPSSSSAAPAPLLTIFEASDDWKEVLPGQSIEPGLHVRMDMTTGQKWAKKLAPEERTDVRTDFLTRREPPEYDAEGNLKPTRKIPDEELGMIAVPVEDVSNTESSSNAMVEDNEVIDAPILEIEGLNRSEQRMAQILEQLPVPESELHDAVMNKLPPEELRAILQKVWARRQAELKEAFADAKTEAQQMQLALSSLVNNASLPERDVVETLENLEYFVATMHNAEDFATMGGLLSTVMMLNPQTSSLRVSTAAAWVIGTAVKGHLQLQLKALEAGAAPLLIKLLDDSTSRCSSSLNRSVAVSLDECLLPLKAANKAIYAIAGLLRFNSRSQDELVALDAPSILLKALNLQKSIQTATSSSSHVDVNGNDMIGVQVLRQVNTLTLKILNVVSDLFSDETSTAERYSAAIKQRGTNRLVDDSEDNVTAVLTRVSLENGERLAATLAKDAQTPIPTPAPLLHSLRMPAHSSALCRVIQTLVSTTFKIRNTNSLEQDEEIEKSINDAALQAIKALSC